MSLCVIIWELAGGQETSVCPSAGISCQASLDCSLKGSHLGKLGDSFSPEIAWALLIGAMTVSFTFYRILKERIKRKKNKLDFPMKSHL